MSFMLSEESYTGKVVLKVNDILGMVDFYQNKIGLDVLKSTDESTVLGIEKENKELVELVKVENPKHREVKTGMYHLAFVVPTRRDLGNILFSLIAINQLDVEGASDHGYSEAIYLSDPEGNGIEIYRDKPKSKWEIQEDGTIPGITIPMDAQGVLDSRDKDTVNDRMPAGTEMGHVHLMVSDLQKAENFYVNVLGLDLKFRFGPQALFLAAGEYHHHVGLNTWTSRNASVPGNQDLGLKYFTMNVPDHDELNRVKQNIIDNDFEVFDEDDDTFKVTDDNGITIMFNVGA